MDFKSHFNISKLCRAPPRVLVFTGTGNSCLTGALSLLWDLYRALIHFEWCNLKSWL